MSELREKSVFDTKTLDDIYEEIRQIYASDGRPWIIGYSGGKDSTCALQLIWYALSALPPEKRRKPVYVISSDTLVETPIIVNHVYGTIDRANKVSHEKGLPFHAEKVKPKITESFWVNLIGRGYPAPQNTFRWCTERMKIRPADRFILNKVSEHGEVILVLGVRKSESMTRAQIMSLHQIERSRLFRHARFPGTYVYAPIKDFSLEDVWGYLLQVPCPWGGNNRDLLAMYQSATAGECPLVIDDKTPSCGNSRFGCWVCTVVSHDRSVTALIDSGQEWMEPLLEIRNFLASTQDPAVKHLYREYKRRTGTVDLNRTGNKIVPGPYKLQFCKDMLRKVLKAQVDVRKRGPDQQLTLISPEELRVIRRLWKVERGDWEDSVPEIYREITGEDLQWVNDDIGCLSGKDADILENLCKEKEVPPMLVMKLMTAELSARGMRRRSSIYPKIDKILREEWRSKEEIMRQLERTK